MSLLPLGGIVNSAAGVPLSQTSGSETERTQRDVGVAAAANRRERPHRASRRNRHNRRRPGDVASGTPMAGGCGKPQWKRRKKRCRRRRPGHEPRQSKDATGLSGNNLDSDRLTETNPS